MGTGVSKYVPIGGTEWEQGSVSRSQAEALCGNRGQYVSHKRRRCVGTGVSM